MPFLPSLPPPSSLCLLLFFSSPLGSRAQAYSSVTCIGLENALSNCNHDNSGSCDTSQVAGAVCSDTPIPTDVKLRLSDREGLTGTLQVYFAGKWGGVCLSDGWSLTSADVACHHLGKGVAISTMGVATSSQDAFFWLSDVRCLGNETLLQQCGHSGWGYAPEGCYEGRTTVWLNCSGSG